MSTRSPQGRKALSASNSLLSKYKKSMTSKIKRESYVQIAILFTTLPHLLSFQTKVFGSLEPSKVEGKK